MSQKNINKIASSGRSLESLTRASSNEMLTKGEKRALSNVDVQAIREFKNSSISRRLESGDSMQAGG